MAKAPPAQRLFRDRANLYDLVYQWKDYKAESKRVVELIRRYKRSDGNALLDVACGTGLHLQYWKKQFDCTGVDINRGMLKVARRQHPDIRFHQADMASFKLRDQFDVILCLFSSIGYAKSQSKLRQTMKTFAAHLAPGGVTLIEPWFTKDTYLADSAHMLTVSDDHTKVCRATVSKARGDVSVMDMHYLVARNGGTVEYFVERQELAMFEHADILQAMRDAGLRARFLKKGIMPQRGLFVGIQSETRAK